ncbi:MULTISPECIES: hypothetical protein [unclassified Halomonas]|uniref:hypothetical protein n=1 Tax=unclassified Halomonas TaxID=2609666 RepID=UPI001C95451F|nr:MULTISPECIES: hypothetical protein [unclassified Halomonas]MBY5925230.1 hypothetical protein [Halomonas sp. DP4Y7-2]MBY6031328.1 hypothetical protein [Halomonas sp. DP8Y7-1]MBY6232271.1 hypothetical protein [Halomonas sp. DP4Y7-1]
MDSRQSSASRGARRPRLRMLITVTVVTLLVALWYLLRYELGDHQETVWYPAAPGCDLHQGPCSASLGEGESVSLAIAPDSSIQPLVALPLAVRIDGVAADNVRVSFEGVDMDMGEHRFTLSAEPPDENGVSRFIGEGQLGICTRETMVWRARVSFDTPRGRVGSFFDLEVERSLP